MADRQVEQLSPPVANPDVVVIVPDLGPVRVTVPVGPRHGPRGTVGFLSELALELQLR